MESDTAAAAATGAGRLRVLLHANLEHATDSQEVKDATLVVEGLNVKIADLASSTITDKLNELLDLTLKLQAIGGRLNNAMTM